MKTIDPVGHLEALVKKHGTQRKAANAVKISPVYFSDLIHGRRDFSDKMLERLGLKRTTNVVKA